MKVKYLKSNSFQTSLIDLEDLYSEFKPISIYNIHKSIEEERCFLDQSVSYKHKVPLIDKALFGLGSERYIRVSVLEEIAISMRSGSVSRYIMATDCHSTFCPDVDLVMFGDSLTEWGPWHDAISYMKILNRGIAGDTTDGMLKRVENVVKSNPSIVAIMAGINDLAQGTPVSRILSNYEALIRFFINAKVSVIVQLTLYPGKRLNELNRQVTQLNCELINLCDKYSLEFLDLNSLLAPDGELLNDFSCDDLHLNGKGYEVWINSLNMLIDSER
jgi:lysophospholipase L1-like esterase